MAIMNPKTAFEKEKIQRFGGISTNETVSETSAASVVNFRILEDGSLEKRNGFRGVTPGMGGARGFWEGELDGQYYALIVCQEKVMVTSSELNYLSQCHTLNTSSGPVSFVYYNDALYLMDGEKIWRFFPGSGDFEEAGGYIPLYGRNWHPTQMGEVHERPNLFRNKIRIHYLNTSGSSTFHLPYPMASIDCIRLDGRRVQKFTYMDSIVTISEGISATHVEIAATLESIFSQEPMVASATNAEVYRDAYHETLFLTGGALGHTVYASAKVTEQMLLESKNMDYRSDTLYLPDNRVFTLGSNLHPITALCQAHDQLLVFNEQSMWAIRPLAYDSEELRIFSLGSDIGCSLRKGAILCNNIPVVLWKSDLYALHFDRSDPNVFTAEKLSKQISGVIPLGEKTNWLILWDPNEEEVWLRDTTEMSGVNWIYSLQRKNWVTFKNIDSQAMFYKSDGLFFIDRTGLLSMMRKDSTSDDGMPINAIYKSHYLCFSNPEFYKRSLHMALCVDAVDTYLNVHFDTEHGRRSFIFYTENTAAPSMLDCRLAIGRFRFLQYEINESGFRPLRVHFLSLSANN